MRFYVIYSFDCTQGYPISDIDMFEEDGWVQTEDDDDWEYNYLAEESPHNAHIWKDGIHRKYVHDDMDKEQFYRFIRQTGLNYEHIETLGSFTEYGLLPALSFTGEGMSSYDDSGIVYIGAYVTPFPEPVRPMFSIRHHKDGFWPLSEEEQKNYRQRRQNNAWSLIRWAFEGACA